MTTYQEVWDLRKKERNLRQAQPKTYSDVLMRSPTRFAVFVIMSDPIVGRYEDQERRHIAPSIARRRYTDELALTSHKWWHIHASRIDKWKRDGQNSPTLLLGLCKLAGAGIYRIIVAAKIHPGAWGNVVYWGYPNICVTGCKQGAYESYK